MMKRQYILILLLLPSINILASNILHYIEYALVPDTNTTWLIQFLFVIGYLIFDILHISLSFAVPIILYRCKKEFSLKSGLIAVSAVLAANIIKVVSEMIMADINYFPNWEIWLVGISMLSVILTSLVLMIKKPYENKVFEEKLDENWVQLNIEQLLEKYIQKIHPKEITVDEMIQFIESKFLAKRIELDEMPCFALKYEAENCKNIVETNNLEVDHFSFEAFKIAENIESKAFYDVMRQNEESHPDDGIIVLIEKETFYMTSNNNAFNDFLFLQKGISKKDYLEKNINLISYLRIIDNIIHYYSKEELKNFKMWDLLPH